MADPYLIVLITTKKFICTGAPSPGQLKAWPITAAAGGVQAQRSPGDPSEEAVRARAGAVVPGHRPWRSDRHSPVPPGL